MKNKYLLLISFIFISSIFCNDIYAQKPKIAIVPAADSTMVIFRRSMFLVSASELTAEIPIIHNIINSFTERLSNDYDIDVILPPDSLIDRKKSFWGDKAIGDKLKKWADEQTDYKYLIFLRNYELNIQIGAYATIKIPENTNGLLKENRHNTLFTTIGFYLYDVSRSNIQWTLDGKSRSFQHLRKIKTPKKDSEFTEELKERLRNEFQIFMNQRVKEFLSESLYIPKSRTGKFNRFKDDAY